MLTYGFSWLLFHKASTKARWGTIFMFLRFLSQKKFKFFLDTSNRERDFWGDVWDLGLSSLGDVCNQKKSGLLDRVTSGTLEKKSPRLWWRLRPKKIVLGAFLDVLKTYLISSSELFGDFLLRRLGRFLRLLVGFSRAWFDSLELLMRACSACRCRFSTVNCLGGGGGDVTLIALKKSVSEGRRLVLNHGGRSPFYVMKHIF